MATFGECVTYLATEGDSKNITHLVLDALPKVENKQQFLNLLGHLRQNDAVDWSAIDLPITLRCGVMSPSLEAEDLRDIFVRARGLATGLSGFILARLSGMGKASLLHGL